MHASADTASGERLRLSRRGRLTLGLLTCLGLWLTCWLEYRPVLSFWFTGVDTFPIILSTRWQTPGGFSRLINQPFLSAYAGEPIAGSVGVRPIGSMAFALDHWLWKLNPMGYHLTNFLLHALNTTLVFLFARKLRLSGGYPVAVGAAVLFAIHPIHAANIPLTTARFDSLLSACMLISLLALFRYLRAPKLSYLFLSLLFVLLSLWAKESGVVLFPMMLLATVLAIADGRIRLRARLVPFASSLPVFAAYWIHRRSAIGGLGGYPIYTSGYRSHFVIFSKWFPNLLVYPFPLLRSHSVGELLANLIVAVFAFGLVLLLVLGVLHYVLRVGVPLCDRLNELLDGDLKDLFMLAAWVFFFYSFYAVVYALTRVFKPYYLYSLLGFWCIILSALLFHASRYFWQSLRRPDVSRWVPLSAGVLVLILGLVMTSNALGSPRIRQFDNWGTAGALGRDYLQAIENASRLIPDGATVFLINLPHEIACEQPPCMGRTYMFEDYSVDSWIRLVLPERKLRFIAVTTVVLHPSETAMKSHLAFDSVSGSVLVQNMGGIVGPPWYSKSAAYFATKLNRSGRSSQVTPLSGDRCSLAAKCYLFDYFEPRKAFALGPTGLVPLGGKR